MTKLIQYRNNDLNNEATLATALKENKIDITQIARFNVPGQQNREVDGSLRNQTLRYYNSNPDLLEAALSSIELYINEQIKEKRTIEVIAAEWANNPDSLTQQDGDDTVTFLENWLFHKYPLMDGISRIIRAEKNRPRRMIDHDLNNVTIFKIIDAYDNWVEKQYETNISRAKLLNFTTY